MKQTRWALVFGRMLAFFFAFVLAGGALAEAGRVRILVQSSPLAGSQYHEYAALKSTLRVGDSLRLRREPENPHDALAVRVEWQGHLLGYVPRRENRAVAAALDRGDPLHARISRVTEDPDPWKRLEFEIWMEL
ncbi:MAG: HIRAN domain-containing protein [Zoogloeaceae bacterium]|jgi:hypothetical protein|nr:HIRAN domain-containing protein [Zoogloeaceae bacterium]